ncbi:ABC transporter substrate-binding protein [Lonepinella sp. BR2357]|uniref:ABC transporter substrate-binding protein n=1 Tax=Lonepinella sp. BR2357 TaxID=3434549 RepID=UPI003F6E09CA
MTMQFKQWLSKIIVIFTALFAVQAVMANDPYTLTQQLSDKLFSEIKQSQSKIQQDPNYLKTIVHQTLMPHVYVQYAGIATINPYHKTATKEQLQQFYTVFGQYIEQQYAQILTLYKDQKITVEKPKNLDDEIVQVTIKLFLNSNAAPTNIVFYWKKNKAGEWKAYDMFTSGGGMINTKKNEWAPILRTKGIDALTEILSKAANNPITIEK